MHNRSSNKSIISDEFFFNSSPSPSQSQSFNRRTSERLPTFNPLSYAAKKERSYLRSAENAIHIIPFVLVLSAIILWLLSSSESRVED